MPPKDKEKEGCGIFVLNSAVATVLFILLASCLIYCCIGCEGLNRKFGLMDDHPAEEILEQQIENEIGLDIDLTPSSPERYT